MKASIKSYFLFLLALIGLNACEKENLTTVNKVVSNITTPNYPLVNSDLETVSNFGEITSVTLYQYYYDNQYRGTSIVKTPQAFTKNDGTVQLPGSAPIVTTTFDYSQTGIVKKFQNGILIETYILRPDGFTNNFNLDANGYAQNSNYQYVNGSNGIDKNLVKTTPTFIGYPLYKDYTFGNDINTIGNKNIGLGFLGKSNYNLPTKKYEEGGGLSLFFDYVNIMESDPINGGNRLKQYDFIKGAGGNTRPSIKHVFTYL